MENLLKASVYVGTYRKYNENSLSGAWLKLSDYSDIDEFHEACRELHEDEEDPEFMFQGYENIPDVLIGESWISESIFWIIAAFENMAENQKAPFLIWCKIGNHDLAEEDIDDLVSAFEGDYIGEYRSEEDFAKELAEGRSDLSDFAKLYFDYEAYADDIFISDYWYEDGYVFYNP